MTKTKRQPKLAPGSFAEAFIQRLEQIEVNAKAVGENMTTVCKAAGISRAVPVRWRHRVPQTILLIDEMDRVTNRFRKKSR